MFNAIVFNMLNAAGHNHVDRKSKFVLEVTNKSKAKGDAWAGLGHGRFAGIVGRGMARGEGSEWWSVRGRLGE